MRPLAGVFFLLFALISCAEQPPSNCRAVASAADEAHAINIVGREMSKTYGGPESNFSLSDFMATHDVETQQCDGVVKVVFSPKLHVDGGAIMGPRMMYWVDL